MTRTRLGLLGLCAMVFGLMAFSATAHAEPKSRWLVLTGVGTTVLSEAQIDAGQISFALAVEKDLSGTPINIPILHSKIAGITVLFECEEIEAKGAALKSQGRVAEKAEIVFSKCRTKLNGATSAPCEPKANGTEKGVIRTKPGHALIVLHELAGGVKDDLVRILPDNVGGVPSETFATIEMSAECAIGTKVPVIGKATLKDCENLALTHLVKHLAETGPLTELWTISKTAEHVATILGSGWATLSGTDGLGRAWSIDPE
jgi:hypothetical protein